MACATYTYCLGLTAGISLFWGALPPELPPLGVVPLFGVPRPLPTPVLTCIIAVNTVCHTCYWTPSSPDSTELAEDRGCLPLCLFHSQGLVWCLAHNIASVIIYLQRVAPYLLATLH